MRSSDGMSTRAWIFLFSIAVAAGLAVGLFERLMSGDEGAGTSGGEATESSANGAMPSGSPQEPTTSSKSATNSETEASPTSTPEDLTSIDLEIESHGYGRKVGDDLFELEWYNRESGRASLMTAVDWSVTDSDGNSGYSSDCQLIMKLSGPGLEKSRRFGECSGYLSTGNRNGWPPEIDSPGEWSLTLIDEKSDKEKSIQFEVLPVAE